MKHTFSIKPIIDGYTRKDGKSAVYLKVSFGIHVVKLQTGIAVELSNFDKSTGEVISQTKGEQSASDSNLILRQLIADVNEVFVKARLSDIELTPGRFHQMLKTSNDTRDLIKYAENTSLYFLKTKRITSETYKHYKVMIGKLQQFAKGGTLPFSEFDNKWFDKWNLFLKNKRLSTNTIWSQHKLLKSIIRHAMIDDGIVCVDPFKGKKITQSEGKFPALTVNEVVKLKSAYINGSLPIHMKKELRRFLFMCFTGLRISDVYNLRKDQLIGDILVVTPQKTKRFDKVLQVKLNSIALQMFEDECAENEEHYLLFRVNPMPGNRCLKEIGERLSIPKKLSHHVGRVTFTNLLLENDTELTVVKDLLGHADIRTTMKYQRQNQKKQRIATDLIAEQINSISSAF